ncbi:MAG: threonine synthase [Clostridia bacterium]|nr:threonine synthase [Clostridia bacterium]
MFYNSTRGNDSGRSAAYVIKNGIAADGGLFVPESIPALTAEKLAELEGMSYPQRAAEILGMFLTDYSKEELTAAAESAYGERFGECATAITLVGGNSVLELWHGPTSAFKDMALQIMPILLSLSLDKCGEEKEALILVATSGDTGKAALAGYADVPKVRIQVFYPSEGVSNIQKLQMATQEGANISVCGIKGNFDDAQSAVKRIFTGKEAAEKVGEQGLFFSSANSINWGRLAPQIVYYVSAYLDMVAAGSVAMGEEINVTVPTGNFGNILAAYIAKQMGLPIKTMICASNKNNILTDFFETGVYDKRRPFYTTSSPSMDILISSNLERLLYFVLGAEKCAELMKALSEKGVYSVGEDVRKALAADFAGFSGDEAATEATIARYFDMGYLCDPHTAVALYCADRYKEQTGDSTPMLVASTASPYKFPAAVLRALGKEAPEGDFALIDALEEISGVCPPTGLSSLKGKAVRFDRVIEKEDIDSAVYGFAAEKL